MVYLIYFSFVDRSFFYMTNIFSTLVCCCAAAKAMGQDLRVHFKVYPVILSY